MPSITLIEFNGQDHTIEAETGKSLTTANGRNPAHAVG
mgnify:CR=1 FL=1